MRATRASLLARAGSAAAVAILAGGGVVATATAAGASTGHHPHALKPTTLSIRNKLIAIHHGRHHADHVTGVLRSHRHGVGGESVTLDSRTGKHRRWTVVATDTTATTATPGNPVGSVSFTVQPTTRTQYKLVFAGGKATGYRGSHSNVISLNKTS